MKLSKAQLQLLRLMPLNLRVWAGPDGASYAKDSETISVNSNTYSAILRRGLIEEKKLSDAYPARYEITLTPAGRAALAEAEGGRG